MKNPTLGLDELCNPVFGSNAGNLKSLVGRPHTRMVAYSLGRGSHGDDPKPRNMFKGFAAFLSRGNVIDLAVAVVMGGAFGAVVTALVKDLITPLIAAIAGKPDFGKLHFTIHNSVFAYGDFLNSLVAFLSISAAIYYIIVLPAQKLIERRRGPVEQTVTACPECLSEIPLAARRCKYCTAAQPAST